MFVLSADGANRLVKKRGRLFPLLAERKSSLPDVAWDEAQTLEPVQSHLEARVEDFAYLIDHLLARPSPESGLNRFQYASAEHFGHNPSDETLRQEERTHPAVRLVLPPVIRASVEDGL